MVGRMALKRLSGKWRCSRRGCGFIAGVAGGGLCGWQQSESSCMVEKGWAATVFAAASVLLVG